MSTPLIYQELEYRLETKHRIISGQTPPMEHITAVAAILLKILQVL